MMHKATKTSRVASLLLLAACLAGLAWCKQHGVSVNTAASATSTEDFVATAEWRTVAPGQRIPPGLHVRMNIQTGATEARLLDKSGSDSSDDAKNLPVLVAPSSDAAAAAAASAKPEAESLLRRTLSSQEMKAALKKIKAETVSSGEEEAVEGQRKFRSYDDLKADFAKLNAAVKTDLEVLQGLLTEWRQPDCPLAVRLRILGEFEYHLRQVDNAQNFVLMGGLELLMGEANATASSGAATANATERAAAALRALAASCQGNAPVQVAAVKAGFLPLLLRAMQHAGDGRLRSLSVLALASVCRNFPHAQAVLLKSGGLAALKAAFLSAATDDGGDRTRLRVVTLLADLVHEADASSAAAAAAADAPDAAVTDAQAESERRRQYEQVGAARGIAETGWCSLLPRTLLSLGDNANDAAIDHDAAEKSLIAMATLADACGAEFAGDAAIRAALSRLAARYQRLAEAELAGDGSDEAAPGEEGFFCQLRDRIARLRLLLESLAPPPAAAAATAEAQKKRSEL